MPHDRPDLEKLVHAAAAARAEPEEPMSTDLDLAALLCSRICHDLISPVGAVGNGLELLDPAREDESEVRDLLSESARTALAALGFFRVAFGVVGSAASPMGHGELGGVAGGYFSGGWHRLQWPAAGDSLGRGEAKLLLLMLLAGVSATPIGGALTVEPPVSAPLKLSLRAEGRRAGLSPEAEALALDPEATAPSAPRDAHMAVLARQAAALGVALSIRRESDEAVVIEAVERR
jgi:histidine phosphotransferase ChpT